MQSDTVFQRGGIGHSPVVEILDQYGFEVRMKPSKFLQIAAPFTPKSDYYLKTRLKRRKYLGLPYLWFEVDRAWIDGDYSNPAVCVSHEGRNRMHTVGKYHGNQHRPVCILFKNICVDEIGIDMLRAMKKEVLSQSSSGKHIPVTGSNFRINL